MHMGTLNFLKCIVKAVKDRMKWLSENSLIRIYTPALSLWLTNSCAVSSTEFYQ